jgi:hypothetical protein
MFQPAAWKSSEIRFTHSGNRSLTREVATCPTVSIDGGNTMKGQMATAREVKARWAFSEVCSDRFGGPYSAILAPPLYHQVTGGCHFEDLPESCWDNLIQGLNTARQESFTGIIDAFGLGGYVCMEWSVEDLMNARVIPKFGEGLCYREFLTMSPMSQLAGALDLCDPRFRAWATPVKAASFVQTEPLISIKAGADHMLIEGYARSILWVRSPGKSLLMWVSA